jgi:[ribosomal protein S18]-alanine N-acetyltransferase
MSLVIRSAALEDVGAILALERLAPSAAHWTTAQYNELVNSGVVLVAEESGRLCGFVGAKAVLGEWEIENVVVAAEFLRRGVASELMRALIQGAKSEAASVIRLEVRESNLPARALYVRHGFREAGRRRSYYSGPDEDAILYSRGS